MIMEDIDFSIQVFGEKAPISIIMEDIDFSIKLFGENE